MVNGGDDWLRATYQGGNLRGTKHDLFTPDHTYSWGLGGLLHDSSNNTLNTPGVSQRVGSTDQFFHSDWLGSTRDLTDSTGTTLLAWQHYDAFGQQGSSRLRGAPPDPRRSAIMTNEEGWLSPPSASKGVKTLSP